jgi:hypothetical protein
MFLINLAKHTEKVWILRQTRTFENRKIELANQDDVVIGRATFEPG